MVDMFMETEFTKSFLLKVLATEASRISGELLFPAPCLDFFGMAKPVAIKESCDRSVKSLKAKLKPVRNIS